MILFCIDLQNFFPHSGCSEQQDIISSLTNIRNETENVVSYTQLLLSFSNWTTPVEDHLNEVHAYHVQLLSAANTELESKQSTFTNSCSESTLTSTLPIVSIGGAAASTSAGASTEEAAGSTSAGFAGASTGEVAESTSSGTEGVSTGGAAVSYTHLTLPTTPYV